MTFTITPDTDPKTLMFEGHPDVEIVAIGDKNNDRRRLLAVYFRNHPDLRPAWTAGTIELTSERMQRSQMFANISMQSEFSSGFFTPEGEQRRLYPSSTMENWPRIVRRVKFDPTKPLIATSRRSGAVFRYELVGTYTPADGSEPIYRVRHEDCTQLDILASTGCVASGHTGSALDFTNGPLVTTHTGLVNGFLVRIRAENGIAKTAEIV